jgi:hypothetical protein
MNTPSQRVQTIMDEAVGRDLTSWERHNFLPSVRNQHSLSATQAQALDAIEARLGLCKPVNSVDDD